MIRQAMATVCLVRLSEHLRDPELRAVATTAIRYLIEHHYVREGDLGFLEYQGKAKLGAAALAALAIVEHPEPGDLVEIERSLVALTRHLWQEGGRFRTFHKPPGATGNENFYPGETLLLWATLLERGPDPELERRVRASTSHYRTWHRENRNPAFVPWHTQAAFLRWKATGDDSLRAWIFEMNDWLLSMQQTEATAPYPDVLGRFYDPRRPHYGPPHASSTGVYLEGLIDAFSLAREVGDARRQEAYRRAIVGGLRSAMQLQFVDEVDLFYVGEPDRVRGGLRTRVYDNAIRVDNVQHVLMAVMKILDQFEPEDYRLEPR